MRELTKLAHHVKQYLSHEETRMAYIMRGNSSALARLQRKAALLHAKHAFDAGFTLHEFLEEVDRQTGVE